jgi:hypothetical protein
MKDIAYTEFAGIEIKAIAASDKEEGIYALYGDNRLFIINVATQTLKELTTLHNIQITAHGLGDGRLEGKELKITIIFQHPYVCVTERFGVNAALYNLDSGIVRNFRREDYFCDVSSFSVGFLEHNSRMLFICQTQWNRLDIYDAETGENLTEREIYRYDTGQKAKEGDTLYDDKNYLDYFHSKLHVSPNRKHFLSNGWHWHPMGLIYLFETAEFLRTFETGSISTHCITPYNWDRPCTFIDNETFVIALDDEEKTGYLDEDDLSDYEYFQLAFFKTDSEIYTNKLDHRWLEPFHKVKCFAFTPNSEGEVTGLLFYDKAGYLVALTHDRGAFAISLVGGILENLADINVTNVGVFDNNCSEIGWNYSTEHHVFYTWQEGSGVVEKKFKTFTSTSVVQHNSSDVI